MKLFKKLGFFAICLSATLAVFSVVWGMFETLYELGIPLSDLAYGAVVIAVLFCAVFVMLWWMLRESLKITDPGYSRKAKKQRKGKFWMIIHNLIAHPLLITGRQWADRFHDWTAERI